MRLTLVALLIVAACSSDPPPRRVDGGAFVLPDAGFRDATVRDVGFAPGPNECVPPCPEGEACGCLELAAGLSCGCHPRGAFGAPCDELVPETCQDAFRCVAGRDVQTRFFCSDGRLDSICSKRNDPDVCVTNLGCVCLTGPSGTTTCTCEDEADPTNPLCDPDVPETCADGVCVRASGPGGIVFFACSDGSEGQPCLRGSTDQCQTSLGCTCPRINGLARCQCSEPQGAGGFCDPDVPDSCVGSLMCLPQQTPNGISTVCSGIVPDAGTEILCSPADPNGCPPGLVCRPRPGGGFTCQPQ